MWKHKIIRLWSWPLKTSYFSSSCVPHRMLFYHWPESYSITCACMHHSYCVWDFCSVGGVVSGTRMSRQLHANPNTGLCSAEHGRLCCWGNEAVFHLWSGIRHIHTRGHTHTHRKAPAWLNSWRKRERLKHTRASLFIFLHLTYASILIYFLWNDIPQFVSFAYTSHKHANLLR